MKLSVNMPEFENECKDVIRLYYADEMFADNVRGEFLVNIQNNNGKITVTADYKNKKRTVVTKTFFIENNSDEILRKRLLNRFTGITVYLALKKHTKIKMPWGALIGVRPTKLGRDLLVGTNLTSLKNSLVKDFYVSREKAELTVKIIKNQNDALNEFDKNNKTVTCEQVDIYINIPYCTSRCNYCSFISAVISKIPQTIQPYTDAIISEIKDTKELIAKNKYNVRSVYIGGGTPTSLPDKNFEDILKVCDFGVSEFTLEAGRPDTITINKLDLMKKYGVTRISINPQSFKNATLKLIGRSHSAEEIYKAYAMAKPYGFKINMDIIAGLSGEKLPDFKNTLKNVLALSPDNVTVHTLSVKHGSTFAKSNGKININIDIKKMLHYSYKTLIKNGYEPYYIYRQKYMAGNLENVGYSKNGAMCINNIDSMEELYSVIACGANAVSKRIFASENRIERDGNVKDIKEYTERVDEMKQRKQNLFN